MTYLTRCHIFLDKQDEINFTRKTLNTRKTTINFISWKRSKDNWEFTTLIFEEAVVSKNVKTIQQASEISKMILSSPEQTKPIWWSDQLKQERFRKLASEVQSKSDVLKKDTVEEVCDIFSAIKLEDEASFISVSDPFFASVIEQLAHNKDWKNLKIQLSRLIQEERLSFELTCIEFTKSIEDIVYENRQAFFTTQSASDFMLCAKLGWKKCLFALAENSSSFLDPETLETILTSFNIYYVRSICEMVSIVSITNVDDIVKCFKWFYQTERSSLMEDKRCIATNLMQRLCCLGRNEIPSWFRSAANRCLLSSIAIQADDAQSALILSDFPLTAEEKSLPAVLNFVTEAAKKKWKDVCKKLIEHGANILSDKKDSTTALYTVFKLFEAEIITIIPEAECARALVNQKSNQPILLLLLNECTKRTTLPEWLQAKEFQQALLEKIKSDLRNWYVSFVHNSMKSAFAVLCELKFKEHMLLLATTYRLAYEWELVEKAFGTEILSQIITQCAFYDATEYFDIYSLLIALFKKGKNEIGNTLLLKILENSPEKRPSWCKMHAKTLIKNLPVAISLNLLSSLRKNGKEALANKFIDDFLTFHKDHFKFGFSSEKIPAKEDRSMRIDQVLLQLYDEYEQTKTDGRRAALEVFAARVINKTPYIGTPVANSSALREFYETIDNATCNTIRKLIADMKKLTVELQELQRTHQSTQLQETKINKQLNIINQFLEAYIDASSMCGGAYLSHAIQQYSFVVLGKSADLKSTVHSLAGLLRHQILELLIGNIRISGQSGQLVPEPQTTHLYDLFLRIKGSKYGIPGHALVDFDDVCIEARHYEEVDALDHHFLSNYTPSLLLDFMQKSFSEEPQKGQFITKAINDNHKEWYALNVPEFIKEIQKTLNSTATTSLTTTLSNEAKQIILKLLSSYSIMLDDEVKDLQSLATLEEALYKNNQFYLALNIEGKTFTREAILQLLIEFQCVEF